MAWLIFASTTVVLALTCCRWLSQSLSSDGADDKSWVGRLEAGGACSGATVKKFVEKGEMV